MTRLLRMIAGTPSTSFGISWTDAFRMTHSGVSPGIWRNAWTATDISSSSEASSMRSARYAGTMPPSRRCVGEYLVRCAENHELRPAARSTQRSPGTFANAPG